MSKLKVLTGQKFNRLLVLDQYYRKSNKTYWKCQCDCGNEVYIYSAHLQSGHTKSCGCLTSKGETKIQCILTENNISFKKQQTFETCRFSDTNAKAFFDFYVDNSYLIEYDGDIHFNSTRGWIQKKIF